MILYFNHDKIPEGLPPNAVLWPELDGTRPRTERETYDFVKTRPNDSVVLTNSSVALFTARVMRAANPALVTLELHLQDGRVVVFDEEGRTDDWNWYKDVVSDCISEIMRLNSSRRTGKNVEVQP
jgi:hypothetical protein